MEYITSRSELPESDKEMANRIWFNMWKSKLWPYQELVKGDLLYWYETRGKNIVWKTRIAKLDRFAYQNKAQAAKRIRETSDFDENQHYFQQAPTEGCCIVWKVEPLQKLNLPKPNGIRFPQQGWLRVDDSIAENWFGRCQVSPEPTLDDLAPNGDLLQQLHELNKAMLDVSPEKVRALVNQTIRHDTKLVRMLKELCEYRCQFPGCVTRIPKRGGGYYVEVAHIDPVSASGQSVLGNLLVLCPNHHKEFDYGEPIILEQTEVRVRGNLNGKDFDIFLPK